MNGYVEIYADGACKGNPGPGGWGAWMHYNGNEKSIFGGEDNTTNNRMELTAVIRALETLKRSSKIKLYTDSSYVQKGMTEWMVGWKAKNWRTADRYVDEIEKSFGTLSTRVFRGGTRGALKIVFWSSVEKIRGTVFVRSVVYTKI